MQKSVADKLARLKTIEYYDPACRMLAPLLFKKIDVRCEPPLAEVLAQEPKILWIATHGPTLGALAFGVSLTRLVNQAGGRHRMPLGITSRDLYQLPLLSDAAAYLTQMDEPMNTDEVVECLQRTPITDLAIMPEGDNCAFGDGLEIQPFRSPRFVEIAIRANVPMMLFAHRGTENWGRTTKISQPVIGLFKNLSSYLHSQLQEHGQMSLPKFPRQLKVFHVGMELYRPALQVEDLATDKETRTAQLWVEADAIKARMQAMVHSFA